MPLRMTAVLRLCHHPLHLRHRQKQVIQHTRRRDRRHRRALARELIVPVRAVGSHEVTRDERKMRRDRGARRAVIQPFGASDARLDVLGLRPQQFRACDERALRIDAVKHRAFQSFIVLDAVP